MASSEKKKKKKQQQNAVPEKPRHRKGIFATFTGGGRTSDISLSFFAYVMILLVVGLIMMASASYAWAYNEYRDGMHYAKSQGRNAIIGVAAMLFFMKMDYHNLKQIRLPKSKSLNIASVFFAAVGVLLIAVLLIGNDEGGSMGAKRWITIAGVDFQPSELAKLSLIIFFAYCMERDGNKMNTLKIGIGKYSLLLGVYVLLIGLEKHISGIVLISAVAVAMIFCGGANRRQFVILAVLVVALAAAYIMWQSTIPGSYVAVRLKSWKDPFSDVLNDTWQTANSLIAIGSGGLFGLGLGNSRQKYLYLPETKNDFVFPIVCEETGFIGALAVIIVFFLLIVEGYSIAARCKDRFGTLIAVGITTQIGIQTVLNLAVVSNLIPNTGISLPFFSYGGTALIMQLVEMGIMLNISQQRYEPAPAPKKKAPVPEEPELDEYYTELKNA